MVLMSIIYIYTAQKENKDKDAHGFNQNYSNEFADHGSKLKQLYSNLQQKSKDENSIWK